MLSANAVTVASAIPSDERLQSLGVDPKKKRAIRFYLLIPKRVDAQACVSFLEDYQFVAQVQPPIGALRNGHLENRYRVVVQKTAKPSRTNLTLFHALFTKLAAKYGGVYDGWEVAVMR